jgi:hypothetical protein
VGVHVQQAADRSVGAIRDEDGRLSSREAAVKETVASRCFLSSF